MQQCRFKIIFISIISILIIILQYVYFNNKINNNRKIEGIEKTYYDIKDIAKREKKIYKNDIDQVKQDDVISLLIYLPSINNFNKNEKELNRKAFKEAKPLLCKEIKEFNLYIFVKENLKKIESFKKDNKRYEKMLKSIKRSWNLLDKMCN